MKRLLTLSLALACLAGPVAGQEPAARPDVPLANEAEEARAQRLFDDIRCVVCQHEAIADSPAGIAADMRQLVREEIASGQSDEQIRQGLVQRYGDFVLFKPPVRPGTWLLWFGPLLAAVAGLAIFLNRARKSATESAPLSREEEARLSEVLASPAARPDPDAMREDDGA